VTIYKSKNIFEDYLRRLANT